MVYDALIVGGGPAGLSAALVLGRCRRHVLLCDDGRPRNGATRAVHAVLTRDGTHPMTLRDLARAQLEPYTNVEMRKVKVVDIERKCDGTFEAALENGETASAKKVLLATGVVDELPLIEGFDEYYGISIHHCAYCDGWEHRDKPIGAYGQSANVCGLALTLRVWSRDIVVFTDGFELEGRDAELMRQLRIPVRDARIARLEGAGGQLARVVLVSGEKVAREALFFSTTQYKRQLLADKLGCAITDKGAVAVDKTGEARVHGVYCAGDNTEAPQMVIVAASEGAKAAVAINKALTQQDTEADLL